MLLNMYRAYFIIRFTPLTQSYTYAIYSESNPTMSFSQSQYIIDDEKSDISYEDAKEKLIHKIMLHINK
ncbi:MAG TPA: hypothetical protein VLG50_05170 [Candidatus Saccharimonadales bacterium]|nr:hypothetical protein [Candidatus Saccharimonadales bacterium]